MKFLTFMVVYVNAWRSYQHNSCFFNGTAPMVKFLREDGTKIETGGLFNECYGVEASKNHHLIEVLYLTNCTKVLYYKNWGCPFGEELEQTQNSTGKTHEKITGQDINSVRLVKIRK